MKRISKYILLPLSLLLLTGLLTFSVSSANVRLKAPKITAVRNVKQGLVISWRTVESADGYIIYRQKSGSSGWKRLADIDNANINSYVDKSVKHSVTYTYSLKAVKGKVKSDGSAVKKSKTFVAAPKIKSVENIRAGVKLQWNKYKNTTESKIYRKITESEKWRCIGTVSGNGNIFVDRSAESGVRYIYQVRQSVGNIMSVRDGSVAMKTFVAAPEKLTLKCTSEGVVLNWSQVQGCSNYSVFRMIQGESEWKRIARRKAGTLTYTDKKAPVGKTVHYKVRAYINSGSIGAFSLSEKIKRVDPKKKMVALTFDDGPYRPVTNQILDVLEKYGARATFFVVGSRVSTYSDCVARAAALGCEIGNHTYNHTTLTSASESRITSEIADTNSVIRRYTGKGATIVRAPGGAVNSRVRQIVNYPLVNWSVDTLDWQHRNTAKVIASVKSSVSDGSIVLMHDLYPTTGNAVQVIVPWLINQGYQLVTVSEMMRYKGIKLSSGNVYSHA